jgi:hypothetical protein
MLLMWLERGKGAYAHEIITFAAKMVKYNPYALPEAPKVRAAATRVLPVQLELTKPF